MQRSDILCAILYFLMAVIDIQLFVIYVLLKDRQYRNGEHSKGRSRETEAAETLPEE